MATETKEQTQEQIDKFLKALDEAAKEHGFSLFDRWVHFDDSTDDSLKVITCNLTFMPIGWEERGLTPSYKALDQLIKDKFKI